MAGFSSECEESGPSSQAHGRGVLAGETWVKAVRLIEGLQHLAERLPLEDCAITERDRVLLATFLNEGAAPLSAAERVCRVRNWLN